MGELSGGCQCGAVRYRLKTVPDPVTVCHCLMCRRATGAPFVAFAPVAAADFELTRGALTEFRSSEIAERGFCGVCGTPLTYRDLARSRVSVTVGSLDAPEAIAPTGQLGAEFALPWVAAALQTPNLPVADWLRTRNLTEVGSRQHAEIKEPT